MESSSIETPKRSLTASVYDDDDDDNNVQQGCCRPTGKPWRFTGLALMCFLGFGSYFCYDNPGALLNHMLSDLGISYTQYSLLLSIYSFPNILLCFVGGFLLDSVFGIRLGTIIYMALAMIGQIIFAFGAFVNIFWLMLLGRFIFGIGAESLAVAQNSYAVLWFKGKELNMVFGLQLSFARLGSSVNFKVIEPIYNFVSKYYKGPQLIGFVLFLASLTCIFSMICAIILGLMDKRTEKILRRGHGEEKQIARLSDVKNFKGIFWLVAVICIAYYVAIFPFIAMGKVFFMRKYGLDDDDANTVNGLLYLISGLVSPFSGIIIDKTGKNVFWVFISIFGTMVSHGMLAFTFINPYICMITMGISYSFLAGSLWPLIALIVPEYQLGTAYGIAQAVQNLGLTIVSLLAGNIVVTKGYFELELFFLAWLWISLITSVLVWISDISKLDGYLNMTPKQREIYDSTRPTIDSLEREKLLSTESTSDFLADDNGQSQNEDTIRNRYITRTGTPIPSNIKLITYQSIR
ncbi:hypothetical protein HCN44_000566 [Aphidius gifuensis]|uniref:Lysosomal dipeptide transporter MFSD1 n=1 Tax=Aphidius gifuensis TaxID=684658 RepID=A0A834XPY9_APHGI|nr:major facilitator superfamily domain-containing protein 1-like isoform X1 [Aphidius gifuensis]KAF7990761.1 hypothetical protein HCN44_000566 [Aphidius gifuensis]